ncbi:MAG: hypothetical protein WB778_05175 [Thermoplasmata archaeon]
MSDPTAAGGLRRGFFTPFVVFGLIALAAAGGALYEMSYYAGQSALSGQALGTTIGIVIALAAFFALGLRAPSNE